MKKVAQLLYAISAFFLISCANFDKVTVSDFESFKLASAKGTKATVLLSANVNNPTARKLILRSVELDVFRRGYTFASITLPEKVVVPSRSNSMQTIALTLDLKNPLALLMGGLDFESDDFTVSGYVRAGTPLYTKKVRLDNVPLRQLASYAF